MDMTKASERSPKARKGKRSVQNRSAAAKAVLHKLRLKRGRGAKGYGFYTIAFGNAELLVNHAPRPSAEVLAESREAMAALAAKVLTPGVKLPPARPGVPRFYVDAGDPSRIVRVLDGKRETGQIEDGQFKAIA